MKFAKIVLMKAFLKQFEPDLKLNNFEDLSPSLLKKHGLKGIIFDLDDTLMPEHSGSFSQKVVAILKLLIDTGFKTGIITNNFSSKYCERVRQLLAKDGIVLPMIENAYKPQSLCFKQMLDFFELQPHEAAMVGDGILTDTYGAKKAGLVAIRVSWFSKSTFKRGSLFILREIAVCAYDLFRRNTFQSKSRQYEMIKATKENSYLFLINPKSGQWDEERIDNLIKTAFGTTEAKENYTIHHCDKFEKLNELFGEDIRKGVYSAVVAIGGDGTVREAIALIEKNWNTSLGIIPTGTGNLLAKSLDIPTDIEQSLRVIMKGNSRKINITKVNGNFIGIVAGAGLDANIMKNTTSNLKKKLGVLAYCFQAVKQLVRSREALFFLNIDGKNYWASGFDVMVINRNSFIQAFIPQIKVEGVDDEWLDICIMKVKTGLDYISILAELFTGDYKKADSTITHLRGKSVRILSWPRLNVQADGDFIGKTPMNIEFYPKRLSVFIP